MPLLKLHKQNSVFISKSTSPYINLAIEDYLFKSLSHNQRKLFLYINEPSIIIGRNQNPWRECNVPAIARLNQDIESNNNNSNNIKNLFNLFPFNSKYGVNLVRRRSGGGTVYHDLGNINFSFITPREEFTRDFYAILVTDALNSLYNENQNLFQNKTFSSNSNIFPLNVNQRHDIVSKSGEKVSGSAFKLTREKAYHHGTLLLFADISRIRSLLKSKSIHSASHLGGLIIGRGVESVPSPVVNLGLSTDTVIKSITNKFLQYTNEINTKNQYLNDNGNLNQDINEQLIQYIPKFDVNNFTKENLKTIFGNIEAANTIYETAISLCSWDWVFGQTPKFTHEFDNISQQGGNLLLTVSSGKIESLEYSAQNPSQNLYLKSIFSLLLSKMNNTKCNPNNEPAIKYDSRILNNYIKDKFVIDRLTKAIDGIERSH